MPKRADRPIYMPELSEFGDLVLCKRSGGYGHQWDDAVWPANLNYDAFNIGYPLSEICLRCESYLITTVTPRGDILNRYYYHSIGYRKVLDAELSTQEVRIHRVARSKNVAKRLHDRRAAS